MKKGQKVKKYRVFTAEFKKQVVDEVEGGKSLSQAAREHQLSPGLDSRNGDQSIAAARILGIVQWPRKKLKPRNWNDILKVGELTLENDLLKNFKKSSQDERKSPLGCSSLAN
jgi:transposase-like protein